MSRFHKTSLVFLVCVMLWLVIASVFQISYHWVWMLVFLYVLQLVLGAIYIQQQFYIVSINSLEQMGIQAAEKKICLTFDDGIHPENTSKVLDILKEKQVRANFFLIGKTIAGNEAMLIRIQKEGHVIGSHSFTHHFWFDMQSSTHMEEDMRSANQAIEEVIEEKVNLFRPPYGVTNPNLAKAINQLGLKSIGWNVRSMDTTATSKEVLLDKLKSSLQPNAIILLHDRCKITTEVLTEFIDYCMSLGYTFATIKN